MKITVIFFTLFLSSLFIYGQDYSKVDKIIKSYPTYFENIDELANRINYDFDSDTKKVRALYNWLSLNINYDYYNDNFDLSENRVLYYNEKDKKRQLRRKKLNKFRNVLKSQKAICLDYSEIFKEVCDRIGIQSVIISGYSKVYINDIDNEKNYKDHAWNAVKINNQWNLLDITWGSSFANKKSKKIYNYYFFTSPEELIKTHFPINSKWQLIENKISKNDFFKSPLFYANYFISKIEIENPHLGVIKANKRKLKIYFNKIPEKKTMSYIYSGDAYANPINFKTTKEGKFLAIIHYKKSDDNQITIYSDLEPVIGFKINTSTD